MRDVRLVDVLDVALLTAFLYVFINWLRDSASTGTFRRALVVFGAVGIVYLLARVVGLYLVQSLVETLFIALLVIAVVVFQSDIRRLIDRLGSWLLARKAPRTAAEGMPFRLGLGLVRFARLLHQRINALVIHIARVRLHPAEFDRVHLAGRLDALPQIGVLDRLPFRRQPAVADQPVQSGVARARRCRGAARRASGAVCLAPAAAGPPARSEPTRWYTARRRGGHQ